MEQKLVKAYQILGLELEKGGEGSGCKGHETNHPEEGKKQTNVPKHQEDADSITKLKETNEKIDKKLDSAIQDLANYKRDITNLEQNKGDWKVIKRKKVESKQTAALIESLKRNKDLNSKKIKTITDKHLNKAKDKISGGLADGETIESIAKHHKVKEAVIALALKEGMKVELEHTSDKKIAKEIALDHLFEDAEYYTKLKKVEKKG